MTKNLNIAFINANWHANIVDQALVGFQGRMSELAQDTRIETSVCPARLKCPSREDVGPQGTPRRHRLCDPCGRWGDLSP